MATVREQIKLAIVEVLRKKIPKLKVDSLTVEVPEPGKLVFTCEVVEDERPDKD